MVSAAPTVTASSVAITISEYINPVVSATRSVFEMMLGCVPTRRGLTLKDENAVMYEVSAVIGISGRVRGTLVVGLSCHSACEVLHRMVGTVVTEANNEVCDAVGELTNMIAGAAKAQLAKYELSLSLPNVVTGTSHRLHFPSETAPFVLTFDSDIGTFHIEVAFHEV